MSASELIIWYICLKLESCANGVYYPSYTAWIQEVFIFDNFLLLFISNIFYICFYSFMPLWVLVMLDTSLILLCASKAIFYQTRTTDDIISWCREIKLMNVKTSFDFLKRCLASCALSFMHQIMIYTFCPFLYLLLAGGPALIDFPDYIN